MTAVVLPPAIDWKETNIKFINLIRWLQWINESVVIDLEWQVDLDGFDLRLADDTMVCIPGSKQARVLRMGLEELH